MNKEMVKRRLKSLIPWRLRYFLKLQEAKGNIHFPENIKQFRLIEQYNAQLYETLKELKIEDFNGKTVCELGPGQHLSHAFLEYQMGAEKEWLMEIADFAHVNSPASVEHLKLQDGYKIQKVLPQLDTDETWKLYLNSINATYSTNGLDGYKDIPDNSVDYCFSYAVFEHIRKRIFLDTIQQIYRFMADGGVCYHMVDFTDHMGGGKNQLRFSEFIWEDEYHYKMDSYTNRIQCSEMCRMLKKVGFEVIVARRQKFKNRPLQRNKLDSCCKGIGEEDLVTANAVIIARKR